MPMKVALIVVGRTLDKHLDALIHDYSQRLLHYLPFERIELPAPKAGKVLSQERQTALEGELIRQKLRPADHIILLDEHGKQFRSLDFANHLQGLLSHSSSRLVFIVGGPYGFSTEIQNLAHEKISLSPMTFSHQMVRLFFFEQLYRAMTILRGEPYHHE